MIIHCTICHKQCNIRPARVERGITNPETFRCKQCWNKTIAGRRNTKLDTSQLTYIKTLARIRRENQYGDY